MILEDSNLGSLMDEKISEVYINRKDIEKEGLYQGITVSKYLQTILDMVHMKIQSCKESEKEKLNLDRVFKMKNLASTMSLKNIEVAKTGKTPVPMAQDMNQEDVVNQEELEEESESEDEADSSSSMPSDTVDLMPLPKTKVNSACQANKTPIIQNRHTQTD